MNIKYYIGSKYGRDHMYIVDKKIAQAIATLTGLKTLSQKHKDALETMGFKFVQVLPEITK